MPYFHGCWQKLQNATCYDPYSRLVYIRKSGFRCTRVASTTHLTFLKNLTNKMYICPSRASPPSVTTHENLGNRF